MVLANTIVSTLLLTAVGLRKHRPRWVFRIGEIKDFLRFGYFQLGERTINYFVGQFDTLLIGRFLGAGPLGIYSMAKGVTQRPAQIISPVVTKVTFPYMAQLQNDNTELKKAYLNTLNYLSSVNFPIYAAIAILAEPLVLILFGNKWESAIPLVRILALFNMVASAYSPVGSLLLAKGRTDLGFYWNLGYAVVAPFVIYAGSFWGATGIATAILLYYVAMSLPFYWILIKRLLVITAWEYHVAIALPLALTLAGCIMPLLAFLVWGGGVVPLSIGTAAGGVMYIAASFRFNPSFPNALKSFMPRP
jgi:O-antigen/teichoic acid export membrane protein